MTCWPLRELNSGLWKMTKWAGAAQRCSYMATTAQAAWGTVTSGRRGRETARASDPINCHGRVCWSPSVTYGNAVYIPSANTCWLVQYLKIPFKPSPSLKLSLFQALCRLQRSDSVCSDHVFKLFLQLFYFFHSFECLNFCSSAQLLQIQKVSGVRWPCILKTYTGHAKVWKPFWFCSRSETSSWECTACPCSVCAAVGRSIMLGQQT